MAPKGVSLTDLCLCHVFQKLRCRSRNLHNLSFCFFFSHTLSFLLYLPFSLCVFPLFIYLSIYLSLTLFLSYSLSLSLWVSFILSLSRLLFLSLPLHFSFSHHLYSFFLHSFGYFWNLWKTVFKWSIDGFIISKTILTCRCLPVGR